MKEFKIGDTVYVPDLCNDELIKPWLKIVRNKVTAILTHVTEHEGNTFYQLSNLIYRCQPERMFCTKNEAIQSVITELEGMKDE